MRWLCEKAGAMSGDRKVHPSGGSLAQLGEGHRFPAQTMGGTRASLKMAPRVGRGVSLGFVDYFDTGDGRVVHNGLKSEIELPLRAGDDVMEGLAQLVEASRFLVDVKVIQQGLPITHYLEDPAAHTSAARRAGAKIELGKMKNDRVFIAGVDRYRIGEMSKPFFREEIRIGRVLERVWLKS